MGLCQAGLPSEAPVCTDTILDRIYWKVGVYFIDHVCVYWALCIYGQHIKNPFNLNVIQYKNPALQVYNFSIGLHYIT